MVHSEVTHSEEQVLTNWRGTKTQIWEGNLKKTARGILVSGEVREKSWVTFDPVLLTPQIQEHTIQGKI